MGVGEIISMALIALLLLGFLLFAWKDLLMLVRQACQRNGSGRLPRVGGGANHDDRIMGRASLAVARCSGSSR